MIAVIGSFDGYHRGHQTLFRRAAELAAGIGTTWQVVTFSPRPRALLAGEGVFLFTEEEMLLLDRCMGLSTPVRIPFDEELRGLAPDSFLDRLDSALNLEGVVVGQDFHFGRRRQGDGDTIKAWCRRHGAIAAVLPALEDPEGVAVSSTRLRLLVAEGRMEEAAELLGYGWFAIGSVEPGFGRGRHLGFPTANLRLAYDKIKPAGGVYAGAALIDDRPFVAAVSVGDNPTFGDVQGLRVEAFLLDMEENLYGRTVELFFLRYLRPMVRFASPKELARQIDADADQSREWFARLWPALPRPVATTGAPWYDELHAAP